MLKVLFTITLLFISVFFTSYSAQNTFTKVEPPHWWNGMKNDTLHLLFYGEDLQISSIKCSREDVELLQYHTSANGKYCFVDLLLKDAAPGKIALEFRDQGKKVKWDYELKQRKNSRLHPQGLDQSDLIYLLTPDRFSSGDDQNDSFDDLNETGVDRNALKARHGGDLTGIIKHIDYLEELGITALWLNPVETNNEKHESYHGYAITDHYRIDPRFGTNDEYKRLVDEAHKRDIKIIRDVVFNHFGDQHPLILDQPDSSWVNHWNEYTKTTYRATVMLDPHAAQSDKEIFNKGWFDHHMPDMNYENKELADYMIQNSIWWIEEYDIDAYRIDTYIYPDQAFMKRWAYEVKEEYPSIFLFAETWVHGSAIQAWFAGGNKLNQGETYLDGVTDFQMYFAINNALKENFGWNTGLSQIYYKLVDDVLYEHPYNNVLFLDNHDLDRFYGSVNQDFNSFKMGIAILFTMRGIPSYFYGTEILMPYKGDHGKIRNDFPGGWASDSLNKFIAADRSELENEAFEYMQHLARWRRQSEAIVKGDLIQFIPEKGIYAYARVSAEESVLVILNSNTEEVEIDLKKYKDVLKGMDKYQLILEQMSYSESQKVKILPHGFQILSFKIIDNEK